MDEPLSEDEFRSLLSAAEQARHRAHAPYSRFQVGAALSCDDGSVFTGCNIENASYGATVCAERVALFSAVAAGKRRFVALAVTADSAAPVMPCGICRQVLAEFAPSMTVISGNTAGAMTVTTMDTLLPSPFIRS